jgi:hypothetical protein
MSFIPNEIVNIIFSYLRSDTAPLIKSFIRESWENYKGEEDEEDEDYNEFQRVFGVVRAFGDLYQLKNYKSCKALMDFEEEDFGSGKEILKNDYKIIYSNFGGGNLW